MLSRLRRSSPQRLDHRCCTDGEFELAGAPMDEQEMDIPVDARRRVVSAIENSSTKRDAIRLRSNPDSRGHVIGLPPAPEHLPSELSGAKLSEHATLEECPTPDDMARWLSDRGLDTSDWGPHTNTKPVKKLWEEVREQEAGVECWQRPDGSQVLVRVVHVMRAKVCSEESRQREVFLFNTWQQFGDGLKRTRNGLLSEKLSISEFPLEDHLHEVCVRAVTAEEMQRLVQANFAIRAGAPSPDFDPDYVCPLTVIDEFLVDRTVEVDVSRSYPRLLTLYHLYTVDIVCTGLPAVDFNTLEFDKAPEDERRSLKYVHAWVWLSWSEIRRYSFEGSKLKERKEKGSFDDSEDLELWLCQFHLDLPSWGKGHLKSVEHLWTELDNAEAHLEHWGRHDGVPLLMRVLHVMQLKVVSPDPSLKGKFLMKTWEMHPDGPRHKVYRLLSKKISTNLLPFDDKEGGPFHTTAMKAVQKELRYLVDSFFRLRSETKPRIEDIDTSGVKVNKVRFVDQHQDLEDSPSFKGIHTMYHLYTVEVECSALPLTNFASVEFRRPPTLNMSKSMSGSRIISDASNEISKSESGLEAACVNGWQWVSWEQALDLMHKNQRKVVAADRAALEGTASRLKDLRAMSQGLSAKLQARWSAGRDARRLLDEIEDGIVGLQGVCESELHQTDDTCNGLESSLPPSMLHHLATNVGGSVVRKDSGRAKNHPEWQEVVVPKEETDDGWRSDARLGLNSLQVAPIARTSLPWMRDEPGYPALPRTPRIAQEYTDHTDVDGMDDTQIGPSCFALRRAGLRGRNGGNVARPASCLWCL